jgi:hypothetical protein
MNRKHNDHFIFLKSEFFLICEEVASGKFPVSSSICCGEVVCNEIQPQMSDMDVGLNLESKNNALVVIFSDETILGLQKIFFTAHLKKICVLFLELSVSFGSIPP